MKKVKLGEVLSLKKGKKATVLAEQTTLSQRYIQIDDLRNNNNLKFTESLNMTEALPDDILIAWDGANAGTVGYGLSGAVGSTITVLKKNERYKEKLYQITWESFWKVNRSIYEIIQQVQQFLI
ncbi:type I restriction-modification system subunit S [Streptococcus pneumoniae]|nr:type I restriction-modification system subunit S [Streptococcus pneumoniae]